MEPVRIVRNLRQDERLRGRRPLRIHRVCPDDFPDRRLATPVSPGRSFEYEVPDMYGRPWAHLWEKYLEQGMERPEEEDIFSFD